MNEATKLVRGHEPDEGGGPGADPGGPFYSAFWSVLRDVMLGGLGDWVDGPPGYFWSGALTLLWIAVHAASWLGPPGLPGPVGGGLTSLGDRARWYVGSPGATIYAGVLVSLVTIWIGLRVWRAVAFRRAGTQPPPEVQP